MLDNQWDHHLILHMFEERDANLIFWIPINNAENDTWYWKLEKIRDYYVKSAYGSIQTVMTTLDLEAILEFKNTPQSETLFLESYH